MGTHRSRRGTCSPTLLGQWEPRTAPPRSPLGRDAWPPGHTSTCSDIRRPPDKHSPRSFLWLGWLRGRTKLRPQCNTCLTEKGRQYKNNGHWISFCWFFNLSLPTSKVHSPNLPEEKCMSEVVRIGSIIIFHLRKPWKDKFFIMCDVILILVIVINPFTPKSDQFQISPAASPDISHHTVWRTWLFTAYSDERWEHHQPSLLFLYISLEKVGRMYVLTLWEWKG